MTTKAATSPAFEALLSDLNTMAKAVDAGKEEIDKGRHAEGHLQSGDHMEKAESYLGKAKGCMAKAEGPEAAKHLKEMHEHLGEAKEHLDKGKGHEKHEKLSKEHEHLSSEHARLSKSHKGEHMTKSFTLQTEGGETIEVQDASDLLKSLSTQLETSEQKIFNTLEGAAQLLKSQGDMLKSMSDQLVAQKTTIGEQDTLIKALRTDLDKLGSAPSGRKAVLTVAERQSQTSTDLLAKAGMPEGVTPDEFFAKALDMQREGKITGVDISFAEAALNAGTAIPPSIVQRVLGSTSKR